MLLRKETKKELREFGLLIGLIFPILIGWILPFLIGHDFRKWTLLISIPFLILGIFKPKLLLYPYRAWMKLGLSLGWINSHIILGIVYVFVLIPIAFFMKIFGYDPLRLKQFKLNKNSYREVKRNTSIDLNRIF